MNNMDLLKAIGDIDDKYLNDEIAKEEKNRDVPQIKVNVMKRFKIKYVLASVCVIIIAVIGISKMNLFNSSKEIGDYKWKVKEVYLDENSEEELAIAKRWDELTITEKFYSVEYLNSTYDTSRHTKIPSEMIGKKLGTATLTGYDENEEINHTINATIFEVNKFPKECVIAVQFEGQSDYYVYINTYYKPKTLRDFMEDLNLKDIVTFGTVYYNYWDEKSEKNFNIEFYDVDDEIILKKLFDNLDLENVYSDNDIAKYTSEKFAQSIGISVDIPVLGYNNRSVSLTDKGYLITNIFETGKAFYIGEEKVQEFIEYVINNYEGYRIVYVDKDGNEIKDTERNEEGNVLDDKIITIENTICENITQEKNSITTTSSENKVEPYIP